MVNKEFPIIGFHGKKGSGKDTAASFLLQVLKEDGLTYYRYAFASPVKDLTLMLLADFGVTKEMIEDRTWKEQVLVEGTDISIRKVAQVIGTEVGRCVDPGIWILKALIKITIARETLNADGVVITDVRFENEAEFIRGLGGIVVHIDNPHIKGDDTHASEAGINKHADDYVIPNSFSLDEFRNEVETFYYSTLRGML